MGFRLEIPGVGGDFLNSESGGWGDQVLGGAALAAGAYYGLPYLMGGGAAASAGGSSSASWMPWMMGGQILGGMASNAANQQMAGRQMDFQERMSSTAHQREAWDLEQAGLNRLLTLGGGASSPPGASATMNNPLEGAVANAAEVAMMKGALQKQGLENKNLETQNEVMQAQKRKTELESKALGRDAEKGDFFGKLWKKANDAYDSAAGDFKKAMEAPKTRENHPTLYQFHQKNFKGATK